MLWFSAEWCGPCQQMEPIVKKLVNQYRERIRVLKVDVDQQLELANDFALRGVPTLVLLAKNGEVDRQIGAAGLKQLHEWLDRSLSQLNDLEKTDNG